MGFGFENFGEGFPFRVAGDFFSMITNGVKDFQVVLQLGDERFLEFIGVQFLGFVLINQFLDGFLIV
jgi:hypothetical protein